jgi:L-ascorbate metabolism protein UlaG (beta-lactamase superfamily)
MRLTQLQQSGFILESNSGFKLGIDIGNKTPISDLEHIQLDAMLISHIHGDHFSPERIALLEPKQLFMPKACFDITTIPQSRYDFSRKSLFLHHPFEVNISENFGFESEAFSFHVFCTDHGPNNPTPEIENFGFLIEMDNEKVYFAGDMFYESGIDVSNLCVDYLLIPVGGFYTFDPKAAFDFSQKFASAKHTIPMHFEKNPETKDEFLKLLS